jgi:hypothetical protein
MEPVASAAASEAAETTARRSMTTVAASDAIAERVDVSAWDIMRRNTRQHQPCPQAQWPPVTDTSPERHGTVTYVAAA